MSAPDPVERLRLAVLSDVHGNVWALESVLADAQGNTDRYLAGLDQVVPPRSEMLDLIATLQWAVDQLGEGACRFPAGLPTGVTLETPAGKLLATHGVPGNDEGFIVPTRSDTWTDLVRHAAQLLLVGHTHRPFVLETGDGLIVNPGSVGITRLTGWRATYALLDLFAGGQIAVQHVQVTWDIQAYIAAFEDGIPLNRKAEPMLKALRQRTSRITPEYRR